MGFDLNPLSAVQSGIGVIQMLGGLFSKPKKRPGYEIPGEFQQNVNLARGVKTMGVSADEYGAQQNAIQRNLATGIGAMQDRRSAIAGIASLAFGANDNALKLNEYAANVKRQNMMAGTQMEMGAVRELAGQKLKKMEWEKLRPFMEKLQQSQALIGAGMQNIMGGVQTQARMDMAQTYANAPR